MFRELVFLVMQHLEEEKYYEALHRLEKESGYFFSTKYLEEMVLAGKWHEIENYLSGFTKLEDNTYSRGMIFEIRKQKYIEALDREGRATAVEILIQDLQIFSSSDNELFKEMTQLLTLRNYREHHELSNYKDIETVRATLLTELKRLIELNPVFNDKLVFPTVSSSRLRTLFNQSLDFQRLNPAVKTLFIDHISPFISPVETAANSMAFQWPQAPGPFPPVFQAPVVAPASMPVPQHQVSISKQPRLYTPLSIDEVSGHAARQLAPCPSENLPTKATLLFHEGSTVTSMEFHPMQNTSLLVGSAIGQITLWELTVRESLVSRPFKIWNMHNCSLSFLTLIAKDPEISVTRVAWSPEGNFIGVAFTKHLIHLYAFSGPNDLRQHIEGAVNDLAFAHPNNQLCVITCGDDKLIKVWNDSGQMNFTFEGHKAPVYSICPHQKNNVQFIFSLAVDGKIKAWLYDNLGSRLDYDAPGGGCSTMLCSADRTRLFSCGTNKDGDSFLVEWDETEGSIRRTYLGLQKTTGGLVQFDTSMNHFLAVGDDGQVKFWDMDNSNVLISTEAGGGLQALPRLRFNKEGNLLAVTTADNGFKILANHAGLLSLKAMETPAFETMRTPVDSYVPSASVAPATAVNGQAEPMLNVVDPPKPRIDDSTDKLKPGHSAEILDPTQCRLATLTHSAGSSSKVVRLLYTNSGLGILALGSNGIQRLWKWVPNAQNPSGKATTSVVPQHWQPKSGFLMTNDVSGVNLEEAFPCIALSNNDSFVMSAAGGMVSLFNMTNFKVMTTFMPSPPASTFVAFNPLDNNVLAIGMEDSTIHIFNVREVEDPRKLEGHQKRISGLAFSTILKILVSAGADAQICFWNIDTWEKKLAVAIQMPTGKPVTGDTWIQFHVDQIHILAVHETQLAIYNALSGHLMQQWFPRDSLPAPISSAVYSCSSQFIYTLFRDDNIGVLDADSLQLRCRISRSAYLPRNHGLLALSVAAHPHYPNQFAVGLTDGLIKVIEPREDEGVWGGGSTIVQHK